MLGIERPHLTLKVEQTQSTFAEGNARWYVLKKGPDETKPSAEYADCLQDEQRLGSGPKTQSKVGGYEFPRLLDI